MTFLNSDLFEGHEPTNDKARCERAELVLKSELNQQIITTQRRASRPLERALGACVASGAMSQKKAIAILMDGGLHD
jgi:hypothetical protein